MDLKIEIESMELNERTAKGRNGDFLIREQKGWAQFPMEKHPRPITIGLEEKSPPFAVGNYVLSPKSLYVDKYGHLTLSPKLVLDPVKGK